MSTHADTEQPDMAVFWIILFGFLLFCVGLVVWVIGIGIRIYEWAQRRREPQVIKGEILPRLAHEDGEGNRIHISYHVGD
jgi:hypothetical protein